MYISYSVPIKMCNFEWKSISTVYFIALDIRLLMIILILSWSVYTLSRYMLRPMVIFLANGINSLFSITSSISSLRLNSQKHNEVRLVLKKLIISSIKLSCWLIVFKIRPIYSRSLSISFSSFDI